MLNIPRELQDGWEGESMTLFQTGKFTLHSGEHSRFKIDCDALTDADWESLARMVARYYQFHAAIGIPNGGLKFAKALGRYNKWEEPDAPILIVDDVLTTGASMELMRSKVYEDTVGVVVFARGPCPAWVHPIFQMWEGA